MFVWCVFVVLGSINFKKSLGPSMCVCVWVMGFSALTKTGAAANRIQTKSDSCLTVRALLVQLFRYSL